MGDNKISEAAVEVCRHAYWHHPDDGGDDRKAMRAALEAALAHLQGEAVPVALDRYDTGLLGDGGGGDVNWWWDYIRSELERAHEFYQDQVAHPQPAELSEVSGNSGELPPLPEGRFVTDRYSGTSFLSYTGEQMQDYARAALAATGKQQAVGFPWENFPAYLIDKCEGDTISEEGIQRAVAYMAKESRYATVQQAGEVQGDAARYQRLFLAAVEMLTQISLRLGLEPNADGVEPMLVAIDALASRQPVGLSPIASRKLEELAAQGFVTNGVAIFNPETGKRGLVDNLGYVGWQGIDLGQFRKAVENFTFRTFHGSEDRAYGDRLLALIDGRDAAPGVGQ